eukprot:2356330-Prymnesium_polylepis.1
MPSVSTPNPPRARPETSTSLLVKWDEPAATACKILHYQIVMVEDDGDERTLVPEPSDALSLIVPNVKPASKYVFLVQAFAEVAGWSEESNLSDLVQVPRVMPPAAAHLRPSSFSTATVLSRDVLPDAAAMDSYDFQLCDALGEPVSDIVSSPEPR